MYVVHPMHYLSLIEYRNGNGCLRTVYSECITVTLVLGQDAAALGSKPQYIAT